jgi:hypothetical protein
VGGLDLPQIVSSMQMVLRDQVSVDVYVVEQATSGTYYEVKDAPAGFLPVFGAKASTGLAGAHLIYQGTWTKISTGLYRATLNLNTTELITAVSTSTSLELIGEFTMLGADGSNRDSTQFTLQVLPDVTRGTEQPVNGVYVACLVREETIGGVKYLILSNSDGVEYMRIPPPGV